MKTILKTFLKYAVAAVVIITLSFKAGAQNFDPVVNDIIESYLPWHSAEFNGKIKLEKLPVSPTVKMYMVRDSLLQVSVRVPLLGEVARIHLSTEELLMVNKMNKTYCQEDPDELFKVYPSLLADIQSIFLARVVILGQGELSGDNLSVVKVDEDGEGNWLLLPQTDPGAIPFNYGYVVGANSRTRALVGTVPGKGSLEIKYDYRDRGEQMDITLDRNGKSPVGAKLDFSSVKWGGTEMSEPKLTSLSRSGIKDFLKQIMK